MQKRWLVTYYRATKTEKGELASVMAAGFISKECTQEEIKEFVDSMVAGNTKAGSIYSNVRIQEYSPERFDLKMSLIDYMTKPGLFRFKTGGTL